MLFSADETADLGSDAGSPVAHDYPADPHFSGTIAWVQLEIRPDDQDHLITAEERLRVAMSRQCRQRVGDRKLQDAALRVVTATS